RDKLEVTHEGTSRVKESKISLLTLDYNLFKTKLKEGIKDMSNHFTHIINGLKVLRKTYPNKEMKKRGSIKQKLKAHIATLSDEDSLENEDQEVANLCLMTIDDIKFSITMVVTEKCDVYSFGMVALETLMEKHLEEVLPWLSSPTYLVNMKLIDVLGNRLPLLTDGH
ncbi:hypothetical protein Goklo_029163, partial [Gossypium klotzschianum]|nr:hypothetical protein [Gossypium klotzschianum]